MSLTDLQNASHDSKKTCDITVKSWYKMEKSKAEQDTKWLLQKWLQMGAVWHSAKRKRVKEERMIERGRAASQWISHSRPGLSAGGCAWGEITGLLPRWSLHRHTATDRKLLAPGCLTDSPQQWLSTAIFSFTHVPLTELDLLSSYGLSRSQIAVILVSHWAGFGLLCLA